MRRDHSPFFECTPGNTLPKNAMHTVSKSILVLGMLGMARTSWCQQAPGTPLISAATIARVENGLASDAMRGRALRTGAGQAARFLEAEFQRIGLQPLPGRTTFAQPFTVYETRTQHAQVVLNGTPVAPEQVLLLSGQPQMHWRNGDAKGPRVVVVGPAADFRKAVIPLLEGQENVLVLIDPVHEARFRAQAQRFGRDGHFSVDAPRPTSVLLVLTPHPAVPASFQADGTTRITPLPAANVVGVLPGRDPARALEQVVFSAHYDHLGILPPVAGDSIANGANDDASGTTAVVALAEYFARQHTNARPLLFVAFTGEEIGSLGAQYFARQVVPAQVVAMLNIEMIGTPAKFGPDAAFVTGFEKSSLGPILQRNLLGTPFRMEEDPYPALQLFYQSDNATLARLGVPAHTITTAQLPTDRRYHTVADDVASLDLVNLARITEAVARGARTLISGQDTPTRIADAGPR